MKKKQNVITLLIFILLFSSLSSFLQETDGTALKSPPIITSTKVYEFAKPANDCDLGLKVDVLFNILSENPNTKGYIIFYNGADQLPAEYSSQRKQERIKADIKLSIKLRGYDENKVVFINGGFREKLVNEIWIVPNGENPPKLTNTIAKPNLPRNKTFLYDENNLVLPYGDIEPYEFLLPSVKAEVDEVRKEVGEEVLDNNDVSALTKEEKELKFFWVNPSFGDVIKNQKDSRGIIIFYADDTRLDINKIKRHIEKGKQKIVKQSKIASDKVKVVYGGYRDIMQADFWIVPKNGMEPEPAPETREK